MSLLTLVQIATDELGLPRPTSVISNSEETVRRLLALANREGKELAEMKQWDRLIRLHTFSTVADQEEYDLPADFYSLVGSTVWNRSDTNPVYGPTSPQGWQELKSGLVGSVVDQRWRLYRSGTSINPTFRIDPVPSTVETLVFEYRSSHWCANADGTVTRSSWVADDDQGILDESLMVLGLVYRWRRALRHSWDVEYMEYMQAVQRKAGADGSAPILNIGRRPFTGLGQPNVPETGLTGWDS